MGTALQLVEAFTELERTDNVSYVLSDELLVLLTNPAWRRFARDNGGDRVENGHGMLLLDVIAEPLRAFYREGFATARRTGEPWQHDYECSSPSVFRKFRMIVYPYDRGFVVTHAPLVEQPHRERGRGPSHAYERDGVITMCAHCRRVRRAGEVERWDWVPDYVAARPANLSHGLCPPCYRYHYPD